MLLGLGVYYAGGGGGGAEGYKFPGTADSVK